MGRNDDERRAGSSAAGSLAKALRDNVPLTRVETDALFAERETASEARRAKIDDRLVEGNSRLIAKIARNFDKRGKLFLDLFQEGAKGVARAIQKFDRTRGVAFSTYAGYWIKQGVLSSLRFHRSPIAGSDAEGRAPRTVSIDQPRSYQSGGTRASLADCIPDDPDKTPTALYDRAAMHAAVVDGLSRCTRSELTALKARFGL